MEWNYLSSPKLQQCNRWSYGQIILSHTFLTMWFLIHAVIKVYSCYLKGPLVYNLVCYSYEVIISSVKTPWSATTARVSGYQTKGPLCLIGKLRLIICVCDKQTSVYNIIIVVSFTMMTSSNGNIFRVTGHLCGEFTGPRWIPHTKASDAELWCILCSASEYTIE